MWIYWMIFGFAAGTVVTSLAAINIRQYVFRERPPKMLTEVDGVKLPPPDDIRWEGNCDAGWYEIKAAGVMLHTTSLDVYGVQVASGDAVQALWTAVRMAKVTARRQAAVRKAEVHLLDG